GRARPAERSRSTDDEDGALIDAKRRIVDAAVIILRTVEDDRPPLEDILVTRLAEITLAEFLRDHRGLHDGEIEQVALEHEEARPLLERIAKGTNDFAIRRGAAFEIFSHGAAGDGVAAAVELAGL